MDAEEPAKSRPGKVESFDVLIVGAGPAGLTAAYRLAGRSPLTVCVLEAHPTLVGGISRTESYKGYLFDIGGHRFFSKSLEIEELWRDILPHDFLERPRKSRILYHGKLFSYPLDGPEVLRNLGLVESFRCLASYAKARLLPVRNPRSFHQWVANQFGERLYRTFFKTYTEKVWGMSCDEISADWAAQRIKGLSLATAALNAFGKYIGRRHGPPGGRHAVIKTLIDSFRYPRRGPGMLWEEACRKIRERGAQVRLGVEAVSFHWDESARLWKVETRTATGATVHMAATHVICSAPLRDVVAATSPPPRCLEAAKGLRYRDFLTVALILRDAGSTFDDNWIYVHDPGVRVGRIQNYRSWSPEMIPQEGRLCLGLEYFCFEGDGLWNAMDVELIDLATRELVALGLASAADVIDGCVVRQPKAYPVYDEGYKEAVERIRAEFEARYPTMQFIGRNGMHRYNNQDHAMMTGLLAAENVIGGERRFDLWAVNEDAEYLEEGDAGRQAALASLRLVPEPVRK